MRGNAQDKNFLFSFFGCNTFLGHSTFLLDSSGINPSSIILSVTNDSIVIWLHTLPNDKFPFNIENVFPRSRNV